MVFGTPRKWSTIGMFLSIPDPPVGERQEREAGIRGEECLKSSLLPSFESFLPSSLPTGFHLSSCRTQLSVWKMWVWVGRWKKWQLRQSCKVEGAGGQLSPGFRSRLCCQLDIFISCFCCNHELSDLKQHDFVILQFGDRKSKVCFNGLKPRCQQGCLPSEGPGGRSFPPFPAAGDHPSSLVPFPLPGTRGLSQYHSQHTLPHEKDPGDGPGPTLVIRDNLSISRAFTYSRLQSL